MDGGSAGFAYVHGWTVVGQCSGQMAPDTLIRDNIYQLLKVSEWDRNEHTNNILKNLKKKR